MWVWRGWHRLSRDRPYIAGGMGSPIPLPIPWRAVVEWCDFHDYAGEDVPVMDHLFREMDAEYFEWRKAQEPKGK